MPTCIPKLDVFYSTWMGPQLALPSLILIHLTSWGMSGNWKNLRSRGSRKNYTQRGIIYLSNMISFLFFFFFFIYGRSATTRVLQFVIASQAVNKMRRIRDRTERALAVRHIISSLQFRLGFWLAVGRPVKRWQKPVRR